MLTPTNTQLQFLQLMQLADSAVPIGSMAHSFGLETLVDDPELRVEDLPTYLRAYLQETGSLEASFCRTAHGLAHDSWPGAIPEWLMLNGEIGALKPAREGRAASATLGRRFVQLVASLSQAPQLWSAIAASKETNTDLHHCAAFGLCGGALHIDVDTVVVAYLQQNVMGLVSACQRLMPLGQQGASQLLWHLKEAIADAALCKPSTETFAFTPLLDLAGMRHPGLMTRLFIS